ncbi:MAG TPA: hypothetical protein VFT46_06255 [Holophagaceae bacterium]|nr:hypothetical protein [Holophagaceae bacterium]
MQTLEIINGDDRPFTLRRLREAASRAKGASKAHLRAVLRSLNPTAARSRATKGVSSMAKKTKKAARHHKRRRTNPTTSALEIRPVQRSTSGVRSRVASAGRRAAANFKSAGVMDLLKEGLGVGIGMLGTSLVEKQVVERFLPASIPAMAKPLIASALVAGGVIVTGQAKGVLRGVAVGAIGEGIRGLGRSFAPTLFAGTDGDTSAMGQWDPQTGQWISADGQVAGVIYDPSAPIPDGYGRPAGF